MKRRTFLIGSSAATTFSWINLSASAQATSTKVRKNVQRLNPNDPWFRKYASAVKAMNELPRTDLRHWENQAMIHLNHCPHGRSEFTIWHKQYLKYFEDICGELIGDPSFALCYWDWTENRGQIPQPFYEDPQLNFSAWPHNGQWTDPRGRRIQTRGERAIPRGIGLQDWSGVFTYQQIEAIQRETSYQRFYRRLEGSPHNTVHIMIDGHMGSLMSPLDPLFWLHHCNVDRLWDEWSAAGNTSDTFTGSYSNVFADKVGSPVNIEKSDIATHDYSYDTIPSARTASAIARRFDLVESLQPLQARNVQLAFNDAETDLIPGIANPISLATTNLKANLFSERTFRATDKLGTPRNASESGRVVAVIKDVSFSGDAEGLEVAVFVNCPYLAPETSFLDPHYAGAFSFFGEDHSSDHMNGDHGNENKDVVIEITSVLRTLAEDGRLLEDEVEVQLLPRPFKGAQRELGSFTLKSSGISIESI